jgi:hypothetical protein
MEFINFILILFLNFIAFVSSGAAAGGGSKVITIAGNFFGRSMNGVSTYATFMQPSALAVDNLDNVYISDTIEYKLWQKAIFGTFIFPIIFFSIAGNILVIIAISKYSYLHLLFY